jgi:xanthine dehydrogenase accessory factor
MRSELFVLAARLVAKEEPFALATVVRRQPASSAQAGDGALITADGTFHGWLGGSCTQPTVVREALKAIADGAPRLIALAPDPQTEKRPGILVFPMTCHSGGSVDIYIEPVLPPSRLVVFGVSPVAQSLARLGRAMGFAVDVADPAADRAAFPVEVVERLWTDPDAPKPEAFPGGRPFVVVATMGERDEAAVRAALAVGPPYLGVVASRKRFAEIETSLVAAGVPPESLASIRSPAGLDIGARAPEEIAISILAEIVRVRRAPAETVADSARPAGLPTLAAAEERDPVCGMMVPVSVARAASLELTAEAAGRMWYFCCDGCREKFLASPARYTQSAGAGA